MEIKEKLEEKVTKTTVKTWEVDGKVFKTKKEAERYMLVRVCADNGHKRNYKIQYEGEYDHIELVLEVSCDCEEVNRTVYLEQILSSPDLNVEELYDFFVERNLI